MIYASAAVGVTCILIGIQLQFEWAPQWVTVCLLFLYAISFTCGAGTVPYVLISELFLPDVSYLRRKSRIGSIYLRKMSRK